MSPWGRVDDSFYDHPKLDKLGANRLPAVGLHWLAISWCNRYLTDGQIPTERVGRLGGTVKLAEALVTSGLWERLPTGYLVHDFLEFNDSREQVEAARSAERDKKRRQRAAGASAVGHDPGSGQFVSRGDKAGESPPVSRGDKAGESPQVSPGVSPQESPATRPVPSRPYPSRPRSNGDTPDDTARYGLPHLTPEVVNAAEEASGRLITTLNGWAAGELDRLVEDRTPNRVITSLHRVDAGDRPSWAQLVAAVRNDLEPLPSGRRDDLTPAEKRAEQREALEEFKARVKAQTKAAQAAQGAPDAS